MLPNIHANATGVFNYPAGEANKQHTIPKNFDTKEDGSSPCGPDFIV